MSPHADPYDGMLDCVYGFLPTRLQILRLLPSTMKPAQGSYVEHPAVHEIRVSWLKIHTDQPTALHTDGEVQLVATRDIEYRILPETLPVLMHAPG
jgi:diacylglycerol kinase family enzyme